MGKDLFEKLGADLDLLVQKIKLFELQFDPTLEREIRMLMIEMRGIANVISGPVALKMELLSNDIVDALQNNHYHKLPLLYKDAVDLKNNLSNL
jgi:hypothetical protein